MKLERCYCNDDQFEDEDGVCIPKSSCTVTCTGSKVLRKYGEQCECDAEGKLHCKVINTKGCHCPKDYYENDQHECILKSTCTSEPPECPMGEIKQEEGEMCICKEDYGLVCVPVKVQDCYCEEGHYRDTHGQCVPKDTCPSIQQCEDDNMEYKNEGEECICQSSSATIFYRRIVRTNLRKLSTGLACVTVQKPACYCKKGYYKDPTGKCVKKSTCPPVSSCTKDEVYKEHGGERCVCNIFTGLVCEAIFQPGCYCPSTSYDGEEGCVPKENCQPLTPCTGLKQYRKSGGEICTCTESQVSCETVSEEGCYCPPDFHENENQECVPNKKCILKACPEGQTKKEKGEFCICSAKVGLVCKDIEKKKCYCAETEYRETNGTCVSKESCKVDPCPEGESWGTEGEECICSPEHGLVCNVLKADQCYCSQDKFRGEDQKCVPKETCQIEHECPKGEHWSDVGESCICENGQVSCQPKNQAGCYCNDPTYRDEYGHCIPKTNCIGIPPCKDNEQYANSGEECVCKGKQGLFCNVINTPACYCKEGEYKDKNGECVAKDTCEAQPQQCRPLETLQENGYECWCNKKQPNGVFCVFMDTYDCYCPENHVRNDKGECVPDTVCPSVIPTCNENESHRPNGYECTCDPEKGVRCIYVNKPSCYCEHGFVRNEWGKCVVKSYCPRVQCPGVSTYQSSGVECAFRSSYGGLDCTPSPVPGCYCPHGYYRNYQGHCVEAFVGRAALVPYQSTPETCRPDTEEYLLAGTVCVCSNTTGVKCEFLPKPTCYCKGKRVWYKGVCVLRDICPPVPTCHGDMVLRDCGKTCNCGKQGLECEEIKEAGCYCPPGKHFNKKGKCVENKKCPSQRKYIITINLHYQSKDFSFFNA